MPDTQTGPVRKYVILEGQHLLGTVNGKQKYAKKGDIVESDKRLDKLFVNKFKIFHDEDRDERLKHFKGTAKIKNLPTNRSYPVPPPKGKKPIIKDEEHAEESEPEPIPDEEIEDHDKAEETEPAETPEVEGEETETSEEVSFGEDVTDNFEDAGDRFLVFENEEGHYTICKKEAPDVPLNKEPLDDRESTMLSLKMFSKVKKPVPKAPAKKSK
jgi:hypothetical protein